MATHPKGYDNEFRLPTTGGDNLDFTIASLYNRLQRTVLPRGGTN